MKLGGSILSLSCDGMAHTVLVTDITGGVYTSVSSKERVVSGTSITHGGGLAHSEASIFENRDESGWFNSIEEEDETSESRQGEDNEENGGLNDTFDDESLMSDALSATHEVRNCCRVANITGRGLTCAITPHGYLGVTGSDGEDDHALRLFDLRLAYSTTQLKNDGFGARDLREAGFSVAQLIPAGISAREALKGGYQPIEVARGGFTPKELKLAGCSLKDLCEAGFDDAK